MVSVHKKYEVQNTQQDASENDSFTLERYEQFFNFFPKFYDLGYKCMDFQELRFTAQAKYHGISVGIFHL